MQHFHKALALFRELNDNRSLIYVLNGMGCVSLDMKDEKGAREYFLESLKLTELPEDVTLQEDAVLVATILGNLGYLAIRQENWEEAEIHMQACLTLHRDRSISEAWPLQNLGALARARGDWPEARRYFELSLSIYRDMKEAYRIADVLQLLSEALDHCGDIEAADLCREEGRILSDQLRGAYAPPL